MITSKLTSRGRTTIPQRVRAALELGQGDNIAYSIENGQIRLAKVLRPVTDDAFATFDEWATETDEQAYSSL